MTSETAEAEVGADAAAESLPVEMTVDEDSTLWKDDPNAQIRRVFRVTCPPLNEAFMTLLIHPAVVMEGGGVRTTEERVVSIEPNAAQQYVLGAEAIEYPEQLKALRRHEARGAIEECAPKSEGIPWIPPEQRRMKDLRDELEKLEQAEAIKRRRIR